jgi:hypothetical protein
MAGTTRVLTFAEGVTVSGPSQNFLETTQFTVYAGTAAYVAAKGSPAALGDAFCDSLTNKILFYGTNGTWQTVNDIKNNFSAVTDPTAGDDSADNYQIGSIWINTNQSTIFIALDVTLANAVWLQVGRALIGYREDHTSEVNGTETDFTISYTPVDDTILVFRNGTVIPDDKVTYVHPVVTLTDAPQLGQKLEIFYLTNGSPTIVQTRTDQRVENRTVTAGEITAKQLTLAATPVDASEVLLDVRSGPGQINGIDYAVSGAVVNWNGYALDGVLTAGDVLRIIYYTVI